MNRADLQQLADERARDAEALLLAGRWSAAYYLAGYAVECALKACVAKRTQQYDFPDKELAVKCYTHNVEILIVQAQLSTQLAAEKAANPVFRSNWLTVCDWNEQARYELKSEPEARKLVSAVTDPTNGVLLWVRRSW